MLDLRQIRRDAEAVLANARDGYESLPMRVAMSRLVTPLVALVDAMDERRGERWLLLEEVMQKTGWSRKWFDKLLKSLGNKSRLQVWQDEGLAEQAATGIWLISPLRVPEPRPGYRPPEPEGQEAEHNDDEAAPTLDASEIADSLMIED